ncbi:MAG: hypothetical protein U0736_22885 [Gemmataceae bacterium]
MIVALKVLPSGVLTNERAVQLFLHEVRAAPTCTTRTSSPPTTPARSTAATTWCSSSSTAELTSWFATRPLSVGLACDYIRQAATGLQRPPAEDGPPRHRRRTSCQGAGHGLTGESSAGQVKVSDFGLARLAGSAAVIPGYAAHTPPSSRATTP